MIHYRAADSADRELIAVRFGPVAERHVRFEGGCTFLAETSGSPVGLLAVHWRSLPEPLSTTLEGFIDIIEVDAAFRRQGIGSHLVALAWTHARRHGATQLRAWSSSDKIAALQLWRQLGFTLCAATTYPGGVAVEGFFVAQLVGVVDTVPSYVERADVARGG